MEHNRHRKTRGRNSVEECQLSKLDVVGSNPTARSTSNILLRQPGAPSAESLSVRRIGIANGTLAGTDSVENFKRTPRGSSQFTEPAPPVYRNGRDGHLGRPLTEFHLEND